MDQDITNVRRFQPDYTQSSYAYYNDDIICIF